MSSWNDQKQLFQKRYAVVSAYHQNQLPQELINLRQALASYVQTGGVTQDNSDPNLMKAMQNYIGIQMNKGIFQTLNQDIGTFIGKMSDSLDTGNLLLENGRLQQEIQALQKKKDIVENDASSAELREKALRFQNKDINSHQLFLVDAPVSRTSMPYLWALSFAFVAIGLLIFTQLIPPMPHLGASAAASIGIGNYIIEFLKDYRVWMSLTAASIIVITVLALKVANVI